MNEPKPPNSRPKPLQRLVASATGLAILLWVVHRAAQPSIQGAVWTQPDWPWALAAWALLALAFACGVQLWRAWLRLAGGSLGYWTSFRLLHRSQLAKYLPGSLWHWVGGVFLAQREGIAPKQASFVMALDQVGQLAGALFLLLVFSPTLAPNSMALIGGASAFLLILVALHPRVLNAALAQVERFTQHPMPALEIGPRQMVVQLLLHACNWALIAGAFALLVKAFVPQSPFLQVALAFPLAWVLGLLSPLAPAGLGVREASLSLLLAGPLGPTQAATMALLARLWFLCGELTAFALAMSLSWKPTSKQANGNAPHPVHPKAHGPER